MRTKIQKWGNGLGLRIPKFFAWQVDVEAGSEVDLTVGNSELVIRPLRRPRIQLKELLRAVTAKNLHEEADTGTPVGREVW